MACGCSKNKPKPVVKPIQNQQTKEESK